jgi:hypothetical protein
VFVNFERVNGHRLRRVNLSVSGLCERIMIFILSASDGFYFKAWCVFSKLNVHFLVNLLDRSRTQSKVTVASKHVLSCLVRETVTRVMCVQIDAGNVCNVIRVMIVWKRAVTAYTEWCQSYLRREATDRFRLKRPSNILHAVFQTGYFKHTINFIFLFLYL